MLMAEADGSNDKRASFSAILKSVGGPLLSQTDAIPDELSANRKLATNGLRGDLPQADFWPASLKACSGAYLQWIFLATNNVE
jgi:hypothetical protein